MYLIALPNNQQPKAQLNSIELNPLKLIHIYHYRTIKENKIDHRSSFVLFVRRHDNACLACLIVIRSVVMVRQSFIAVRNECECECDLPIRCETRIERAVAQCKTISLSHTQKREAAASRKMYPNAMISH